MTAVTGSWRTHPATQSVCAALLRDKAQVLFVGGCVRNALLDVPVSDIDIATSSTPHQVIALAQAAGIKAIPTGIDHGTVTLVAGGIAHEITTFRRDVETDGRHAVVAFSDRVEEDAARRDFTMNALYARPDGLLIDPLKGLPDLLARRVRFIGDAQKRIREDYLRSLRYFRFHAWYGDQAEGLDAGALAAIGSNIDGIEHVSKERIGAELLKLLGAPNPAPSVAGMRACGLLGAILPGADDRALAPLVDMEERNDMRPDALRRLAALGVEDVANTLRLSNAQSSQIDTLHAAAVNTTLPGELGFRLKYETARDVLVLRAALMEYPVVAEDLNAARGGAEARFPVKARDLMPTLQGPALGARLAELEARWIASGFTLSRDDLLRN